MGSPVCSLISEGVAGTVQDGIRNPVGLERYEYKYVIPSDLLDPIRSCIAPYCDMDPYAARESGRFYAIRTLYLDSDDYRTFRDKEDDVTHRFKLRVRTYGRDSAGPVKFEVKRRFNDVFLKSSVVVPADDWPRLLRGPAGGPPVGLTAAERSAFDHFLRLTLMLAARPKMLIRYERQAYRSRIDPYVRISFDRHIRHQPTGSYDLSGAPWRWASCGGIDLPGWTGEHVVMEFKFKHGAPIWLSDMIRRFELVRRGFSKYCLAVTRTLRDEAAARELALTVAAAGPARRRRRWQTS